MLRDFFQGIDVLVVHTGVYIAVKGLDYHERCSFLEMRLLPVLIQHSVKAPSELNGMPAVYFSLCQYSQCQIDLFLTGLYLKDRFDTIERKGKLHIEFFYVGVEEFIGAVDIGYACQAKLDGQA